MSKKILMATGQENLDKLVSRFEGYDVIGSLSYRKELEEACAFYNPEIVLVTEGLTGHEPLFEILIKIKQRHPDIRLIYLAGEVDLRDTDRVNKLGMLVLGGIYDISHEASITVSYLKDLLDRPKTEEQMAYLTKHLKTKAHKEPSVVQIEVPDEELEDTEEQGYKNVFVVSSIKPGTGKSFISTNIATAIAKYGKKKANGERPRVALIEADLQNLSVGTLLGIEDDRKNLKSVMEKISKIITSDGELIQDMEKIAEVDGYIKSCFKPYYQIKNLEALVGSQLSMSEIEDINPLYYVYLIESILKDFDVIVIDSNSSLAHITTYPLLRLAHTCYYVLNLDFNNVRNNARYKETLHTLGILDRVKYILNEDIVDVDDEKLLNGTALEELIFTAEHLDPKDFPFEARIPEIPKAVFLNRLYEGIPIVLDNNDYTLKARYEITKIANQIWDMENIHDLEKQVDVKFGKKDTKSGWFGRGK